MLIQGQRSTVINETVSGYHRLSEKDFTHLGDNRYLYEYGKRNWDPTYYFAFNGRQTVLAGEMRTDGTFEGRQAATDGEWERYQGGVRRSGFMVYSESPAFTVDYAPQSEPALELRDCEDCIVEVEASKCGMGLTLTDCRDMEVRVVGRNIGNGINLVNSKDIEVLDCDLSDIGCWGVRFDRKSTGWLHHSTMQRGGLSESTAFAYLAKCNGVEVFDNDFDDYTPKNRWEFDGCAVFTENNSTNNRIYRNTVRNHFWAFKDNSGMPGNRFYVNNVINCTHPFIQSDSKGVGRGDPAWRVWRWNFVNGQRQSPSRNTLNPMRKRL